MTYLIVNFESDDVCKLINAKKYDNNDNKGSYPL